MSFVPVSVQFDINTADGLRFIVLSLTSTLDNERSERWIIKLQVLERANPRGALQVIGDFSVELPPEDFDGARTIAHADKLCEAQRAQALVAAETLKDHLRGDATADDVREDMSQIVRAG